MIRVLDASALLAFVNAETGAERVRQALDGARVCTVNWSEVVQKSLQRMVDVTGMRAEFAEIGVVFERFTATQAETAAQLWRTTRSRGLSLGDRACLALAIEYRANVLTADRAWSDLGLGIAIELVR